MEKKIKRKKRGGAPPRGPQPVQSWVFVRHRDTFCAPHLSAVRDALARGRGKLLESPTKHDGWMKPEDGRPSRLFRTQNHWFWPRKFGEQLTCCRTSTPANAVRIHNWILFCTISVPDLYPHAAGWHARNLHRAAPAKDRWCSRKSGAGGTGHACQALRATALEGPSSHVGFDVDSSQYSPAGRHTEESIGYTNPAPCGASRPCTALAWHRLAGPSFTGHGAAMCLATLHSYTE